MLRRLFRRGPNKPPVILGQLAQALEAMGLQATVLSGGEHEPAAPSIDPGLSERVVGRIAITGGPPDALQIGVLGPGQGHLSSGGATAYHALIRRGELAESWPDGRVEAKRQFRAGQIGPARDFHWTAADNSSASREAAQHLNGLNALRSDILHCLQQPQVLVLELAPVPDRALLRLSLHVGGPPVMNPEDLRLLRDIARSLFTAPDDSPSMS